MTGEALTAPSGNRGGRIFLYAGLLLGVVAAALVAIVLSDASEKSTVTQVPATRLAVVAAEDIPANTRITADMLKVGIFQPEDVDAESFGAVSQVVNRVTSSEVVAGQPITPALVSDTRGEGLTFTIAPGMRGMSIGVQEVVTAGGNVVPGNFVDVIAVVVLQDEPEPDVVSLAAGLLGDQPLPPIIVAGGFKTLTLTVLQNVRVLAVDQTLPAQTTGGPNASAPSDASTNPRAGTVTLEVTPDQAQVLALADNVATLRLSLRPFGEESQAPVAPLSAGVD
jgi:pilus assembly protein CpaB